MVVRRRSQYSSPAAAASVAPSCARCHRCSWGDEATKQTGSIAVRQHFNMHPYTKTASTWQRTHVVIARAHASNCACIGLFAPSMQSINVTTTSRDTAPATNGAAEAIIHRIDIARHRRLTTEEESHQNVCAPSLAQSPPIAAIVGTVQRLTAGCRRDAMYRSGFVHNRILSHQKVSKCTPVSPRLQQRTGNERRDRMHQKRALPRPTIETRDQLQLL